MTEWRFYKNVVESDGEKFYVADEPIEMGTVDVNATEKAEIWKELYFALGTWYDMSRLLGCGGAVDWDGDELYVDVNMELEHTNDDGEVEYTIERYPFGVWRRVIEEEEEEE